MRIAVSLKQTVAAVCLLAMEFQSAVRIAVSLKRGPPTGTLDTL